MPENLQQHTPTKLQNLGLIALDNAIGPIIPFNKRIEGYPNRVRGSARLWRARGGLLFHTGIYFYLAERFLSTGNVEWPLAIANIISTLAFTNFNNRRRISRLFKGTTFEQQIFKKVQKNLASTII